MSNWWRFQKKLNLIKFNPQLQNSLPFLNLTKKKDNVAKSTLYIDIPKYFSWQKGTKDNPPYWKRRERGRVDVNNVVTSDAVGRIPTLAFNAHLSELYYLRILLHHKTGPTCHNDLKMVCIDNNEVTCATFQEACMQLGLLNDDKEIGKAMEEASLMCSGDFLRYFFCSLLILCQPVDPLSFWNDWKIELCRDKMVHLRLTDPN